MVLSPPPPSAHQLHRAIHDIGLVRIQNSSHKKFFQRRWFVGNDIVNPGRQDTKLFLVVNYDREILDFIQRAQQFAGVTAYTIGEVDPNVASIIQKLHSLDPC